MSLITEQIKELNECAKKCQQYPFINVCMNNEGHDFRFIFRNAADTIKTLSEKVRAANVERSTAYYNGGWIPVSERLPEERGVYIVTEKVFSLDDREHKGRYNTMVEQVEYCNGKWKRASFFEVIAWMPLPTPYVPETNIGKMSEIPTGSDPQESEKVN